MKKAAGGKESLTRSRRPIDQETGSVIESGIAGVKKSVIDVTSGVEKDSKVSDKAFQVINRTSVSSKVSIGARLVLLASETAENQISDDLQEASLKHYKWSSWAKNYNCVKAEVATAQ